MSASAFVTRFAPSPTGFLHRGHAFSAITAQTAAREAPGRFLLRIEDIDVQRCRPHFESAIYEDLAWLGLTWETPVRRQSEHLDDYRQALGFLADAGLLYRCFKTRAQVLDEIARAPHGPTEAYRGAPLPASEEARRLAEGAPFAWRLSLDAAERRLGGFSGLSFEDADAGRVTALPRRAGDVVLARKDVGVAYHLAVVVDDALQGVTQVIRAPTFSRPRTSSASSRPCWVCRRQRIAITACCWGPTASASPSGTEPRRSATCGPGA